MNTRTNPRAELQRNGFVVLHRFDAKELLNIASEFGQIDLDSRDQIPVKDIRPQPRTEARANTLSSRYGTESFPFHTETAYLPSPSRMLLLFCVDPGAGTRPTLLLDSKPLLDARSGAERFGTWTIRSGRLPSLCHAFSRFGPNIKVRYDPECMRPSGSLARIEEVEIHSLIKRCQPVVLNWKAQDLLILDNERMLHGRGESKTVDQDRWLKRVLVS